jgi:sugar (pentulose or hexulose) kinase
LLRAAVEGLACELARYLSVLAEGGHSAGRLLLSGGAASSRVSPQIIADVTGRPVAAVTEPAVSALGAAILARAMVEPDRGLRESAEALASASRKFAPGPHARAYDALLRRFLAETPL